MDYRGIGEPGIVKDGFLSISMALEVLSLLPLKGSEPPEKLLRQWMLMGRAQGILVQSDNGKEFPIVSAFWQSVAADPAFQTLIVSARVHVDRYTESHRKGWVVLNAAILRGAALTLLPVSPDDVAFFRSMQSDNIVKGILAKRREEAFDEAVRRCRDARSAGGVAGKMSVPILATPEMQEKIKVMRLERFEAIARAQAGGKSLGSVTGGAPAWQPTITLRGGRSPAVRRRDPTPEISALQSSSTTRDALSGPAIKQKSQPGRKKANDRPLLDQMKKLIEEAANSGETLSANAAAYQVALSLHGPKDLTRVTSTQSRLANKYLNE